MKMNDFDCVAMKHNGAERVLDKTRAMTRAQELAFWELNTAKLKRKAQQQTTISFDELVELLAVGWTEDELLTRYPYLTRDDIQDGLEQMIREATLVKG